MKWRYQFFNFMTEKWTVEYIFVIWEKKEKRITNEWGWFATQFIAYLDGVETIYRWCQNVAHTITCVVLQEIKPLSHKPYIETVGDCVLIKLQSYFSMVPSDCVHDGRVDNDFSLQQSILSFYFLLLFFVFCCVCVLSNMKQ